MSKYALGDQVYYVCPRDKIVSGPGTVVQIDAKPQHGDYWMMAEFPDEDGRVIYGRRPNFRSASDYRAARKYGGE